MRRSFPDKSLPHCDQSYWEVVFMSIVKLISVPTFLSISFLWGGLLGGAVRQQEKAKHQANPSCIHNTWKNTRNPPQRTTFWGSTATSSSQLWALARLMLWLTHSGLMRKSFLKENKCFTDVFNRRFVLLLKGWREMDDNLDCKSSTVQTSMTRAPSVHHKITAVL